MQSAGRGPTQCLYVSREERGAALGVERSQQQAICLMARNSDRYWGMRYKCPKREWT